ncbi:hypothetical protein BCR44DRAFT_47545 [Catenaria anguillulae PL171]|uniref:Uncharacterized protein n=1 Tax=Catenaria anguillulae PL171 TaxID=765915 RepID=A0A1Y2HN09_9FUNG|nr:hypothetical protein BCR44DRAFT_47545 [Catenaria anguillulae PL171]
MSSVLAMSDSTKQWSYLEVKFSRPLDRNQVAQVVTAAVIDTAGLVVGAQQVDVLSSSADCLSAILRVPVEQSTAIWASLTMVGSYGGHLLRVTVTDASAHLLSLGSKRVQL